MEKLIDLLSAQYNEEQRAILDKMRKTDLVDLIVKQGYEIKSNADRSEENKKKLEDQNSSHNVIKRMMFGFLGYDIGTCYNSIHNLNDFDVIGMMGQVLATADSSKFTAPEKAKD